MGRVSSEPLFFLVCSKCAPCFYISMRPPPSRLNLGNWKVMRPLLYRFLCQALTAPAAACRIQPFKLMKRVVEMVLLASALRVCISTTLTLREERRGEEKRVANGKSQAVCLYLRAAIKREKRGGGKKKRWRDPDKSSPHRERRQLHRWEMRKEEYPYSFLSRVSD